MFQEPINASSKIHRILKCKYIHTVNLTWEEDSCTTAGLVPGGESDWFLQGAGKAAYESQSSNLSTREVMRCQTRDIVEITWFQMAQLHLNAFPRWRSSERSTFQTPELDTVLLSVITTNLTFLIIFHIYISSSLQLDMWVMEYCYILHLHIHSLCECVINLIQ